MLVDLVGLKLDAFTLIAVTCGVLIFYSFITAAVNPLRDIKGPLPARFTRLWELWKNWQGYLEHVTIALHERYGSVVRVAPNRYSVADPAAIRIIYGAGSKFTKSAYYTHMGAPDDEHKDVFAERSNAKHAAERRKMSSMYAMSSLVSYEAFVDKVNCEFINAMDGHARTGREFDLFTWMQFYAFDVIGEITLGRSFGLVAAGSDKDGLLHAIHVSTISYGSMAGLVPEVHPWCLWLQGLVPFESHWKTITRVIFGEVNARLKGANLSDRKDFLEKCVEAQEAGKMDIHTTRNVVGANIGAGSDTTGISLTAVIYFLMKNPTCMHKLRSEIDAAQQQGLLSEPITFQQGQKLPYLQASIKEALRLHPAVGQILSRVVPEGGAELAGTYFPSGTVVGVNAWVIHRDRNLWGEDVNEFKPERWLVDQKQLSIMEQHFLAFGAGARTCIGKNISLLEMTKLVPELVRRFDFEPANENEWITNSGWFVKQTFGVKLVARETGGV